MSINDPHLEASAELESRYPKRAGANESEVPPVFRRRQYAAFAVVLGLPMAVFVVWLVLE